MGLVRMRDTIQSGTSYDSAVPTMGQLKIAQRFNAGQPRQRDKSRRDGRKENAEPMLPYSAVPSGLVHRASSPGVKTPGYCRVSLRDHQEHLEGITSLKGRIHRRRGERTTTIEIGQGDAVQPWRGDIFVVPRPRRTQKLRRSDIGWNMSPLRGLRCCESVRFYKDSAPTELALSGPPPKQFP